MGASFLENVTQSGGLIDPSAVAKVFGITKCRLADGIGLPAEALYRKSRVKGRTIQARLRDFIEFTEVVVAWHGTPAAVFNWYSWHPLLPFGGRTAEEVFRAEGVESLKTWVGQVEAGVYI